MKSTKAYLAFGQFVDIFAERADACSYAHKCGNYEYAGEDWTESIHQRCLTSALKGAALLRRPATEGSDLERRVRSDMVYASDAFPEPCEYRKRREEPNKRYDVIEDSVRPNPHCSDKSQADHYFDELVAPKLWGTVVTLGCALRVRQFFYDLHSLLLTCKVTGAPRRRSPSRSHESARPVDRRVRPAAVHLAGAGAGGGTGMGRMLAIRHPAAVFTSV